FGDATRLVGAQLALHDRPVGAIVLQRGPGAQPFEAADRELLHLLASQVPVALELARLLCERDELHASLHHTQKMEAVGQLAAGVAHDLNNTLTAVWASQAALAERMRDDDKAAYELSLISKGTERAAELTRTLLAFSRRRALRVCPQDVNEVVADLKPMLARLIGDRVALKLTPGRPLAHAKTDRAALEQALVNLAITARDAMPAGGELTIATSNAELDDAAVRRGAPRPGEYVALTASDTGHGMTAEVVDRIFEPFFTTKAPGTGT